MVIIMGNNNIVITIARQYGSGGRTVGEMGAAYPVYRCGVAGRIDRGMAGNALGRIRISVGGSRRSVGITHTRGRQTTLDNLQGIVRTKTGYACAGSGIYQHRSGWDG